MKINIEKLISIGKKFNNFNNVFKYEILTKLAKDNGNIVKYDLINDYELKEYDYDSSYIVKNTLSDEHTISNLEKHLTKHIQKDKDYDGYGKLKVKDINDVIHNEKIEFIDESDECDESDKRYESYKRYENDNLIIEEEKYYINKANENAEREIIINEENEWYKANGTTKEEAEKEYAKYS